MAKPVVAVKADYVRKNGWQATQVAINHQNEYKKGCEQRMTMYDNQPVLVRKLIAEIGMMGSKLDNFKTTNDKCKELRRLYQIKIERSCIIL